MKTFGSMKSLLAKVGAALTLAVGFSTPAFAGNVTASLSTVAGGAVTPSTSNLDVRFMNTSGSWMNYSNALVGKFNWINASESGFSPSDAGYGLFSTNPTSFNSFCIEGTQNVHAPGTATFTTTALANAPSPNNIAAGIINGMGAAKAQWMTEFWNENIGSVNSNTTGAAFQLGIWAIVYNAASASFFSGNGNMFATISANKFQITNKTLSYNSTTHLYSSSDAAVLAAANMLSSVNGSSYAHNYDLIGLTSQTLQDQVVAVPAGVGGPAPSPVPLPAALPGGAMLLSGLLGGKLVKRVREKKVVC